jgi:hypothetical protein
MVRSGCIQRLTIVEGGCDGWTGRSRFQRKGTAFRIRRQPPHGASLRSCQELGTRDYSLLHLPQATKYTPSPQCLSPVEV